MSAIIPACVCTIALCLIYRFTESAIATMGAAACFIVMAI